MQETHDFTADFTLGDDRITVAPVNMLDGARTMEDAINMASDYVEHLRWLQTNGFELEATMSEGSGLVRVVR